MPQPARSRAEKATALARSIAGMVAFQAGLAAGATVAIATRNPTRGLNFGAPFACSNMLRAAGVKLNVIGEENLEKARPAIVVLNHQSSLEIPIIGKLLDKDYSGVAKRSARYDPRSILTGFVVDPVWIDRSKSKESVSQIIGLTEKLDKGISLILWPEGTRGDGIDVLPFKKGFVHMAIQGGVPVLPVVIRNAGELMASGATLIYPGTVDVAVLPPVDTSSWTKETAGQHAEDVRQLFVDTLQNWPSGD